MEMQLPKEFCEHELNYASANTWRILRTSTKLVLYANLGFCFSILWGYKNWWIMPKYSKFSPKYTEKKQISPEFCPFFFLGQSMKVHSPKNWWCKICKEFANTH